MNISEHITLKEAIKSDTAIRLGISNIPSESALEAMKLVANACFEPLRAWHGKPIGISSFYRSPELNHKIGGSKTSQHCKGEAIDIDGEIFGGIKNIDIFNWIKANCKYDQLIGEMWDDKTQDYSWVHVSYSKNGNRNQALIAYKDKTTGKTKYKPYGT